MVQKIFFLNAAILMCLCNSLQAQSTMQGRISDTQGKGLANATTALVSAKDSSLVKGIMTNNEGDFTFENIAKGHYRVYCTFTGYAELKKIAEGRIKN